MRTQPNPKLALCVATALIAAVSCAGEPTLSGPSGRVAVSIAGLDHAGLSGATVAITVLDDRGDVVFHADVRSEDHRAPNGRVVFIAPCAARGDAGSGPTGGLPHQLNTVRVELLEVRAGGEALSPATGDVSFPPPTDRAIACVDGGDVRADFQLTFVRRAQEGFSDTVQIGDALCSYAIGCEQHLADNLDTPAWPALVTAFGCTGDPQAPSGMGYLGFEGTLCCGDAAPGDPRCTALTIAPDTGAPVWSAPGAGVLDTHSDVDGGHALGEAFHDTVWRLDPGAVGDEGCAFHGRGYVNWSDDGAPAPVAYSEGGDGVSAAPAFLFTATIASADASGAMRCVDPSVAVAFAPAEGPAPAERTAFAYGGADATCVSSIPGLPAGAWGWSNGPLAPSAPPSVYPLVAEASGCDVDQGVTVGEVTTTFTADGAVTVTIATAGAWRLTSSQLHLGAERTPVLPSGAPTIAAGQFTYADDTTAATHTYTIPALPARAGVSGAVYLVARATVGRPR